VIEEMPPMEPCLIHLGPSPTGNLLWNSCKHESARFRLSVDMQSFVRQVDAGTGIIQLRDVPAKREIISLAEMVKSIWLKRKYSLVRMIQAKHPLCWKAGSHRDTDNQVKGALVRHQGQTYFDDT